MAITHTPGIPDRGPHVFVAVLSTGILTTIFMLARAYCRILIIRNITIDDYFLLLAWVLATGLSCNVIIGASAGIGRHDKDISWDQVPRVRETEYVFTVLYYLSLCALKTSILMFYLRLSKNTNKFLRLASWVVLIVVNLAGLVLTLMNLFQCKPIKAAWSPMKESYSCIPLLQEFLCSAPVNVISDLAILLLPIPVLTGMNLPLRQKVILVGTFVFGIFITIIDVVRTYYLQQAYNSTPRVDLENQESPSNSTEGLSGSHADLMWYGAPAIMWSVVEVNLGIIWACIPTLKPLFIRILPRLVVDPNVNSKTSASHSINHERKPQTRESSTSDSSATIQLPPPTAIIASNQNREISMIDFLAENSDIDDGDMDSIYHRRAVASTFAAMPSITEVPTVTSTLNDQRTSGKDATYFGFVDMPAPRSLLTCTTKQSWKYGSSVSLLFFLWGCSYGILNSLNTAVSLVKDISTPQTIGLSTIYFGGGYFFGPLVVGGWILRRDEHQRFKHRRPRDTDHIGGFKVLFMVGLCFYGIGTMIFWPSSILNSYSGFMLSNLVVGFGLSILETGANTYMILCGPDDYAELRLMLAQGFQATGSVVMNVLARKVFFRNLSQNSQNPKILINVQWSYFAITLLCAFLTIYFYYVSVPEVTDAELKEVAGRSPVRPDKKSWFGLELRTVCVSLAVLSQWTYCSMQGGMRTYNSALMLSIYPEVPQRGPEAVFTASVLSNIRLPGYGLTITEAYYISQSCFVIGRFVFAYLLYLAVKHPRMPKPRVLLLGTTICTIILCIISSLYQPSRLGLLNIPVSMCYFFMGPIWPLIFSIALRHQGERTKTVSVYITMGASGPAIWLFAQYGIINNGSTANSSFFLLVGLQVITLLYPLFLNFSRDAKLLSDPVRYYASAADGEKAASSRRGSVMRAEPVASSANTGGNVALLDYGMLLPGRQLSR
ncbi:hypothetical protein CFIMG_001374RA [Ceratocystis fimbriata CBS 114723]|uniref:Rhodopsin domain-containing protein n=1 Tax=Ceratocystis fimbriata CBS 114723 TaxID=1035309 RepID=A0A2C5X3C1_9PEZI|nr:hypothetical protein CFIMG_001374RA [Ceratocystis fimbriata CBS 114723]